MSFRCWGVNWIAFITPSHHPHGSDHQGVPPLSPSAIVGSSGPARLYIRQSSPQQVAEHKESTSRQYALADVAVALGWPRDRVEIVDADQGRTGQTVEG